MSTGELPVEEREVRWIRLYDEAKAKYILHLEEYGHPRSEWDTWLVAFLAAREAEKPTPAEEEKLAVTGISPQRLAAIRSALALDAESVGEQ